VGEHATPGEEIVIPADDVQRAAGFYQRVFDCDVETRDDETCHFAVPPLGGWSGARAVIRPRAPYDRDVTNYFRVESLRATTARVERHHGRVLVAMLTAGQSYLSLCQDTEGNRFSIESARSSD
jgi:predicted enzyme related to lactoylglutathione lyase